MSQLPINLTKFWSRKPIIVLLLLILCVFAGVIGYSSVALIEASNLFGVPELDSRSIAVDGDLDLNFAPNIPESFFYSLLIQGDGKILTGGLNSGNLLARVQRLNSDGTIDPTFSVGVGGNREIYCMALQPDKKIIIGGFFDQYNGVTRSRIARLNSDGTVDTSFDPGIGPNSQILSVAIQSDGKIVVGGQFTALNGAARNGIARLNQNGSLDSSFAPGAGLTISGTAGYAEAIAIQLDGKIVIGGSFDKYNNVSRSGIVRVNGDGSLDTTFTPGSGTNSGQVSTLTLQNDGKILIGSGFTSYNGVVRRGIARINSNGSLDTSFNPGTGVGGSDPFVLSTAVDALGRILIGGPFTSFAGVNINGIARLGPNGVLDTTFNSGSGATPHWVKGVAVVKVQANGNVLIGGDFSAYNDISRRGLARLLSSNFGVSPSAGPQSSTTFTTSGSEFTPNGNVAVIWVDSSGNQQQVGSAVSDNNGRFTVTYSTSCSNPVGSYSFKAWDAESNSFISSSPVTLTASPVCTQPTPTPTPTSTPPPSCAAGSQSSAYDDTKLITRPGPSGNNPLGDRMPVILIHGIHGNRIGDSDDINNLNFEYFENLVGYLNSGGTAYDSRFKTYSFHYVSDRYTAREIGKALRDHIDERPEFAGKQVILIAHSMGGIVARHYMLWGSSTGPTPGACSGERVLKLISLATPHHGAYGANGQSRGDRFSSSARSIANTLLGDIDRRYWRGSGCETCISNPQQVNRQSLLWDNYDGLFNLYPNETPSDIPNSANYPFANSFYNDKIVAYSGVISPDDPSWQFVKQTATSPLSFPANLLDYYHEDVELDDFKLAIGGYFVDSVFFGRFNVVNVPTPGNDGLVPIESARFDGVQVNARVHCPGYNHLKMEVGALTQCNDGKMLFKSVRDRVIETAVTSSPLLAGELNAGFGNQNYGLGLTGQTNTRDVELSNMGDGPLQITSLSLTGQSPDQFAIVNVPSTPFTLQALSSVKVKLAFNPTSPGEKKAQLRAENSSSNSVVLVNISGTGLPQACGINFSPSSQFVSSAGGQGTVMIGNISCPWTVSSTEDWIHPASSDNRVTFFVDSNTTPNVRYGTIIISVYGRSYLYSISQDAANSACWLSLSSDQSVSQTVGGTGSFYVTTPDTCSWNFQSNEPWLVANQTTLQGSGSVSFTVAGNIGASRSGVITIQGQITTAQHTVHQLAGNSTQFDFDGDGNTDLSIFRPNGATGSEWWYLKSSNGGNYATQFGSATDKLVAADYTGDGKADIAFWRPSTGEWFILRSEDSSFYAFPFGGTGDIPAPADYDGDGKADAAVFRPSTATWFIQNSGGGTTIQAFGAAGDQPVAGDYDGDGKADLAIFRPNGATGSEWWILRSTAGLIATQFGVSTDKAVAGDYTGDGKVDVAFWRPSTGQWYILRSEDFSFYAFPFGASTDIPVPGDYDGDGKTDAAVFRPSSATWFAQGSTSGTIIQQFGTTGDIPVPNEFVR